MVENEKQYLHDRMDKFESKLDALNERFNEGMNEMKVLIIPRIKEIDDIKEREKEQDREIQEHRDKIGSIEILLTNQHEQKKDIERLQKFNYKIVGGAIVLTFVWTLIINWDKLQSVFG